MFLSGFARRSSGKNIYRYSRITAALLSAVAMAHVFFITFGAPGMFLDNATASLIAAAAGFAEDLLVSSGADPALRSLVTDGIFAGVGSVLSFVPSIALLFLQLSILEKSGFIDMTAYALEPVMAKAGLPGQAAVPLLIGFGCNVPAVLSASETVSPYQRNVVMPLIPFMSCSAKLPVYMMFTSVFFKSCRLPVIISLYAAGMITAALRALIIRKLGTPLLSHITDRSGRLLSPAGSCEHCCRKCPVPGARRHDLLHSRRRSVSGLSFIYSVIRPAASNTWGFVKKAFTVIFLASAAVWYLQNFDCSFHMTDDFRESILWELGKLAAPLFQPMGSGSPHAAAAIIAGFSAREAILSTFSVMSSMPGGLSAAELISETFSPLPAFTFMLFCLLYTPCIATLAAIRKETGSILLPLLMCITRTLLAWTVCMIVYNAGSLLNI